MALFTASVQSFSGHVNILKASKNELILSFNLFTLSSSEYAYI